jgi:hypothetical protein
MTGTCRHSSAQGCFSVLSFHVRVLAFCFVDETPKHEYGACHDQGGNFY